MREKILQKIKRAIANIRARTVQSKKSRTPLQQNIFLKKRGAHSYKRDSFAPFSEHKKRLLGVRRMLKSKKPKFLRYCASDFTRLDAYSWRKPRGAQNKLRRGIKSKGNLVKHGYSVPKAIRYTSARGYRVKRIFCTQDLNSVNTSDTVALIAKKIGFKRRVLIENQAMRRGIYVKNFFKIRELLEKNT